MTDDTMFTQPTDQSLPCARVESLASEWVDGALSPALRAAIESHLDGCENCSNLVADLAAIASEARALPRLEPSRDLWAGIAARIETPVVALEPRRLSAAPSRRWWTMAAAAAALVAVTAGVTWRLATENVRQEMATVPSQSPAPSPTLPGTGREATVATGSAPDSGPTTSVIAPTPMVAKREVASGTRQAHAPVAPIAPAPVVQQVALPLAARAYDAEIAVMRSLVDERRESLDPVTVRVLERNLKIIDQAIAESRAALGQDPASGLLAEQLTRAMRRKLELLRTVADLPARIS